MSAKRLETLPEALRETLQPLMGTVESVTVQIHHYDKKIAQLARSEYPETARLRQVTGVGELIALSYVLTLDDPHRFRRSRDVGGFLGLRPKRRDSGASRPQLRITKEGDPYLRKLLVQGRAVYSGLARTQYGLAMLGAEASGAGREKCEETRSRCGSP